MQRMFNNPILVMMRGLPGSGKSRIAHAVKNHFDPETVVILDPDETDYKSRGYQRFTKELKQNGVDEKLYPYRYLRSQAYHAIERDQVVLWNQAFTHLDIFRRTIANLQAYARDKNKQLDVLVVEVEVTPEVAKARVAARVSEGGHDVTDENFARFLQDYKSFKNDDFDPLILNGEKPIDELAAEVAEAIVTLNSG